MATDHDGIYRRQDAPKEVEQGHHTDHWEVEQGRRKGHLEAHHILLQKDRQQEPTLG